MKRKVLIALLCVTALCWLCAGALAEKIYDTAEVNFDSDGINQWMTVQVYPRNSGVYVEYSENMRFHAYGHNDYVFAGYRVYDKNNPFGGDSSDPYAQFGTAVEGIGYMSDMEHPVFTAIFEKKVNIAVSPEGAGYARYYVAEKVFRAKPRDNGWRFIGWKYVADEWTVPVNYTSTDATWPMENPQTTGTYTAYFEENPLYSITLEQPENFGTFSVSVNGTQNAVSAYAGDTVTLSLAPVLGYGIDSPVFTPAGGEPQRIYRDNNTGLYSFKMPEADVSVSLSFRPYTVILYYEDIANDQTIIYSSADQAQFPDWRDAENCQFYVEDDGTIGFKLAQNYHPSSFPVPQGSVASGWTGNEIYNRMDVEGNNAGTLTYGERAFKVQWVPDSHCSLTLASDEALLSPDEDGYMPFTLEIQKLTFPPDVKEPGDSYCSLEICNGTLYSQTKSIDFKVFTEDHDGDGSSVLIEHVLEHETPCLSIYIDPLDLEAAGPGTYIGTMEFVTRFYADCIQEINLSYIVSLRLIVPEPVPPDAFGPASFTIPSACTSIEKSTFEETTALTVVDAGHVTAIGPDAFSGCTGLTQIRLPADCTIDASAFTGCGTVFVFAPAGGTTESGCKGIANCMFVKEPQH